MIREINFKHSLIFFNLCIIFSAIEYLRNNSLIFICLFLILTIGISHGALDNIKGKKLQNNLQRRRCNTSILPNK